MNTKFLLLAQYHGQLFISLDQICADYFTHLSPAMLERKVLEGKIRLPITRIEPSNKAPRGVHIDDLANYIDAQRAAAVKECEQLNRRRA